MYNHFSFEKSKRKDISINIYNCLIHYHEQTIENIALNTDNTHITVKIRSVHPKNGLINVCIIRIV